MKNLEDIIGFDALYKSMEKCKRGVMWKSSTSHFVLNAITEIKKLENELRTGTYKPKKLKPFFIHEPKKREVLGMAFRDRVFQRSLTDNIVYPVLSKRFIYDNAACQVGKGTSFARKRLKCFMQRHFRKYGDSGYVLQCDIAGYYPNMNHKVLENKFRRYFSPEIYNLILLTLNCAFDGDKGYYAGSQIMQLAGAMMLDDLDHFVKEKLMVKYYIRYMDDFVLIHNDKGFLKKCRDEIVKELAKIGFKLHPKKTKIVPISSSVKFLGFYFRLKNTGKVIMSVDSKNIKRMRKKLFRLKKKVDNGEVDRARLLECFNSWKAHAEQGDSYKLVDRVRNMI